MLNQNLAIQNNLITNYNFVADIYVNSVILYY